MTMLGKAPFASTPLLLLLLLGAIAIFATGPTTSAAAAFVQQQHHHHHGNKNNERLSKTRLFGQRMKNQPPQKLVAQTEYLQLESDGSDAWKTMDLVDILQRGGVGVLPTDTGYGFVTPMDSKSGLERIMRINEFQPKKIKPISILCSDLASIDQYCLVSNKRIFKTLKTYLPGPYTFLLPSKTTNRGMLFDDRGHKYAWKRQTLGVCIPNDPVLRYFQDELLQGIPLLFSPLPRSGDDDDDDDDDDEEDMAQLLDCEIDPDASWCNQVDFIANAGPRPYNGATVYDMTLREPELVQEGIGNVEVVLS